MKTLIGQINMSVLGHYNGDNLRILMMTNLSFDAQAHSVGIGLYLSIYGAN